MKAAELSDVEVLQAVGPLQARRGWATRYDLEDALNVPAKVLRAKLRRLLKRELVTGCACGCRGDFELTDAGEALLKETG